MSDPAALLEAGQAMAAELGEIAMDANDIGEFELSFRATDLLNAWDEAAEEFDDD